LYSFCGLSQSDRIFPNQVIVAKDCYEDIIEGSISLFNDNETPIEIFKLKSNLLDIAFHFNDIRICEDDTLMIPSEDLLEIKFKFRNNDNQDKLISYSSESNNENIIRINLGSYYISTEEVKSRKKKIINIKDNCSDSIKIFFPYGGTISSVSVYKNMNQTEITKSICYGFGEEDNFIKFGKNEIGIYYIKFMSCHWGENFWLQLINE